MFKRFFGRFGRKNPFFESFNFKSDQRVGAPDPFFYVEGEPPSGRDDFLEYPGAFFYRPLDHTIDFFFRYFCRGPPAIFWAGEFNGEPQGAGVWGF